MKLKAATKMSEAYRKTENLESRFRIYQFPLLVSPGMLSREKFVQNNSQNGIEVENSHHPKRKGMNLRIKGNNENSLSEN